MEKNILTQMLQEYDSFTRSERKIADYVLEHQKETQYISITDLSAECEVAVSTVSLFCRKLRLAGFNDFKLELARAALPAGSRAGQLAGEVLPEDPPVQRLPDIGELRRSLRRSVRRQRRRKAHRDEPGPAQRRMLHELRQRLRRRAQGLDPIQTKRPLRRLPCLPAVPPPGGLRGPEDGRCRRQHPGGQKKEMHHPTLPLLSFSIYYSILSDNLQEGMLSVR